MFVRFDPCRDFEPLSQPFGRRGWGAIQRFVIPMDAYLEDENVVVNFDFPGLRLDAIALTLETNLLTVRAERAWAAWTPSARSGSVKRVAAAAGEGAMAVRLVHEYLSSAGEGSSGGEGAAVPVDQRSA